MYIAVTVINWRLRKRFWGKLALARDMDVFIHFHRHPVSVSIGIVLEFKWVSDNLLLIIVTLKPDHQTIQSSLWRCEIFYLFSFCNFVVHLQNFVVDIFGFYNILNEWLWTASIRVIDRIVISRFVILILLSGSVTHLF